MLLTSIRVEGLRCAPEVALDDLAVVQHLPSGPEGAALADGLLLAQAALRPAVMPSALRLLDVDGPDVTYLLDEIVLDEVEELDAHGVDSLVAPALHRHVTVHLDIRPDPLMFRRLRDLAARDPRLLAALGTGADLHVRVGWLFNRAGTHASVAVLAFHVGSERFSTAPVDRPPWLLSVLTDVGEKLLRVDPQRDESALALALHDAALSPRRELRAGFERARLAMHAPPFSFGPLHLIQARPRRLRLALGDDLLPVRVWGPRALEAVRLVHAALVIRPDVLVVDHPGTEGWVDWLASLTEGDDATLEQVLVLDAP